MEIEEKARAFDEISEILKRYDRNGQIRDEYKKLRTSGLTGKESRTVLSQKYFCSMKNIEAILYKKETNA